MKKILIFLALLSLNFSLTAQIDIKLYGQKILNNKVKPTDDKQTFQIIDSLLCRNKNDRTFYFKIFTKIQQTCDAALSEYVSVIAYKYYFNNNFDFIKNSSNMSDKEIHKWLNFIAFEAYLNINDSEKDLLKFKSQFRLIESKFTNDSAEKAKCKKFNEYLYKKTLALIKLG